MWKQEPRELSSMKLTWMCLMKEDKQEPGRPWQSWIHASCLTNRPQKGPHLGLEVRNSPITASKRNLLGLSGLHPFPPSSTIQGCSETGSPMGECVNHPVSLISAWTPMELHPQPSWECWSDPIGVPDTCLGTSRWEHTREAKELMVPMGLAPPKAWTPGQLPSPECCWANPLSTVSLSTYCALSLALERRGRGQQGNSHYVT